MMVGERVHQAAECVYAALCGLITIFAGAFFLAAHLVLLTDAAAQSQSDQLGRALGTAPDGAPAPSTTDEKVKPIRAPLTVRAGQSTVVRAGASAFGATQQPVVLVFKIGRRPACGNVRETAQGIILEVKAECAGQTLEFDYEVSAGTPGSGKREGAVRVEVKALVQAGIESCGIANVPYEFMMIPAGPYSLKDAPPQLKDLADLLGAKEARVEAFCITEEAVPAAEIESFLAQQTLEQKRKLLPEAVDPVAMPSVQVDSGRGLRSPAVAVSHRMASSYAQHQSEILEHTLHLPRLEHYVAAALYLVRKQPNSPSTHSFFVSLRGGLIEWTDTPCDASAGTFTGLGARQRTGVLDKFCYEPSQRVARMGFRLVALMSGGNQ